MEFGLWNAWWFFLYYWLPMPLLRTFRPANLDSMSGGEVTAAEARQRIILYVVFFVALAYSLFVPFRVGTIWFSIGLPVALFGAVFYGFAVRELMREELEKAPLMRGAYRFSRHPLYVAEFIMFIGVAAACTSVWILLFALVTCAFHVAHAADEERDCLERYGAPYAAYLNRTPRWLGIPSRMSD